MSKNKEIFERESENFMKGFFAELTKFQEKANLGFSGDYHLLVSIVVTYFVNMAVHNEVDQKVFNEAIETFVIDLKDYAMEEFKNMMEKQ